MQIEILGLHETMQMSMYQGKIDYLKMDSG